MRWRSVGAVDAKVMWPLLALAFGLLAAWQGWRQGHGRGAPRAWGLLAVIFAAVSLWLHRGA